jgi:hypothetical protein
LNNLIPNESLFTCTAPAYSARLWVLFVSKKQMAEMKNQFGVTCGGAATEKRIVGAMMSGRWSGFLSAGG